MIEYAEYPITMTHPHYTPAKSEPIPGTEIYGSSGQVIRRDFRGTPEKYAPVTVGSELEEERLKAEGYERAGKIDPSAWARQNYETPSDEYKPDKYPMWKGGKLVNNAEEDEGATAEDLAAYPAPIDEYAPTPNFAITERDELRKELQDSQSQMQTMAGQMQEMMQLLKDAQAINAELRKPAVEAETESEAKAAPATITAPKAKRAYTWKTK